MSEEKSTSQIRVLATLPLLLIFLLCAFGRLIIEYMEHPHQATTLQKMAHGIGSFSAEFPAIVQDALSPFGVFPREAAYVKADPRVDETGFTALASRNAELETSLSVRVNKTPRPGYRLVTGVFDIDGDIQTRALLINPDLQIQHSWILDEKNFDPGMRASPWFRKSVHGVALTKTGELIFTFDGGNSIQKLDYCGQRQWINYGNFHHALTLSEDQTTAWGLLGQSTVSFDMESGEISKKLSLSNVLNANPDLDILKIRNTDYNETWENSRDTPIIWTSNAIHLNDVDPLPSALADAYPDFEAGDLLISARSLDLVYVIDPDTSEIKWWRIGAWRRQHDPDWSADGKIYIYDNRMGESDSFIVSIDPQTYEVTKLFPDLGNGFYSRIRGKHQRLEDGYHIITSAQQGYAFEIDAQNEIALEFINNKPNDDSQNMYLSEVMWLPEDYFTFEDISCP